MAAAARCPTSRKWRSRAKSVEFALVEPGSLVGTRLVHAKMPSQPQLPPRPLDHEVFIEARDSGEWIVSVPGCKQPLHVYRLGPTDWLVSEVGRSNEGRGSDLTQALGALSRGTATTDWWKAVAEALQTYQRTH
jgi:hypothetical protein